MFHNKKSNAFNNVSTFASKNKIRILIVIVLVIYLLSFVSFKSNIEKSDNNNNNNKNKNHKETLKCQDYDENDNDKSTCNIGVGSDSDIQYDSAIVVLGYSLHPDGMPTQILKERVLLACEYYSKLNNAEGSNTKIILSGKGKQKSDPDKAFGSEAEAMNEIALQNDVSPRDILIENNSSNTAENALFTLNYLEKIGVNRLFIVTSDFHVLRTQYIFQTIFPPTFDLVFVKAKTTLKIQESMRSSEKILFKNSKIDLEKLGALEIPGEKIEGYHPYRNLPRWRMIERELNLDDRDVKDSKMADYGSNQGFFSIQLAQKFPDATVFSFEGEAMNEYKSAASIHEGKIQDLGLKNNYLCKTRILPSMFEQLSQQHHHLYEYQFCLSIFHWFDMKTQQDFEDTLSNHLMSSRTTFIELPEAMLYKGREGQHAWGRVNTWYQGRNEDEILYDIRQKYNLPKMTWKTLGAILHENNTVRKLIRVDVNFENDIRKPLQKSTLVDEIYNCGQLMHK
ncbi:hypothetical protein RB653_009499 [Dictyostelium firmibasis]|uniref:DUF218 domain-containing protein n=1 Tax=Dictyostelium firmibasis TaxID=79012 RepID=A0AAN7TVK9_9MYCE